MDPPVDNEFSCINWIKFSAYIHYKNMINLMFISGFIMKGLNKKLIEYFF